MTIEVDDIGDLINKGNAAFDVCYTCQSYAPITQKCVSGHTKKLKWEKDEMMILRFTCSRYLKREHGYDPYDW